MNNFKNPHASDYCRGIFFDDPLYDLPICLNSKNKDNAFEINQLKTSSVVSHSFDLENSRKCEKYFTGGENIYFCEKSSEGFWEKTLDNSPSLVIALLAVCVSLSTLRFMSGQDNRNAIRSIDDEYILRRIISPNIIEPIFDLSREIIGFTSQISISTSNVVIEEAFKSYLPQVRAMQGICASLNVVPENFKIEINKVLGAFEDILVASAHDASINRLVKAKISNTIATQSNRLLQAVRSYQIGVLKRADMPFYKKCFNYFMKK